MCIRDSPKSFSQVFTAGLRLTTVTCHDGDMSQLFAATFSQPGSGIRKNLVPLFWATSAYVGNGVMGLRIQAESGPNGVFQLLVDNNNVGRGGHRRPTGYFRLHTNAAKSMLPLTVTLRQQLFDGIVKAHVADRNNQTVCNLSLIHI